jgi:hypothetical protein
MSEVLPQGWGTAKGAVFSKYVEILKGLLEVSARIMLGLCKEY